jgi:hypothetical protein
MTSKEASQSKEALDKFKDENSDLTKR